MSKTRFLVYASIIFLQSVSSGSVSAQERETNDKNFREDNLEPWAEGYSVSFLGALLSPKYNARLVISISPDGKYAFQIQPQIVADHGDSFTKSLYLIQVSPFKAVLRIQEGVDFGSNLSGSDRINWAPNSSGVVVEHFGKSGPAEAFAFIQHNGSFTPAGDLIPMIKALVKPVFDAAKIKRYDFINDFVVVDEPSKYSSKNEKDQPRSSCTINSQGQVEIKTYCTNDPDRAEKLHWEIEFSGTWDCGKQAFISHSCRRVPE